MSRIININSPVFKLGNRLWQLIILNLLFILTCLPMITIGASLTALYYTCLKLVRKEESSMLKDYWHSFKLNFKQSTVIFLIVALIGLFLFIDYYYIGILTASAGNFGRYVFYAIILLYLLFVTFVFPLQSRFSNPISQTLKLGLILTLRYIPYTFSALLITVGPSLIWLLNFGDSWMLYTIVMTLIGYSGTVYLHAAIFNQVFKPYVEQHHSQTPAA